MWLRPGTLLDLTVLASEIHAYQLAEELGITKAALSNYISGLRYIRDSAVHDIASRWATKVKHIVDIEIDPFLEQDYFTKENYLADFFRSAYDYENGLRLFADDEYLLQGFAACAAYFIAPESKYYGEQFTSSEARQLLNAALSHTESGLATKYLLWRIHTREGYYLDRVPPEKTRRETRDMWPIPMLDRIDIDNNYAQLADLPARAALKKPTTIDIMGLTSKISLSVDSTQPGAGVMFDRFVELECTLIDLQGKPITFRILRTNYDNLGT